jgi:hypothetical protein
MLQLYQFWLVPRRELSYSELAPSDTKDPVKSMGTIAHSVRLQGSALVSYRIRAAHGWPGNQPFRV